MKDVYVVIYSVEAETRLVKLFDSYASATQCFDDMYDDIVACSKNEELNFRYDKFEIHDIVKSDHDKAELAKVFGEQYANKEKVWFECPDEGDYSSLELIKAVYNEEL